jgi:hypothetical protein
MRILAMAAGLADLAGAADPREWSLKELFQESQFVVEGRLVPRSARPEPISFADTGTAIPTLARDSWRFVRGQVHKNVLGQDLPDTLLVFDAGTAAAVAAQRAAYLGGTDVPDAGHWYRGPLSPASLPREGKAILFLVQVQDDSLTAPRERFELAASLGWEKIAARARVRELAARSAAAENP